MFYRVEAAPVTCASLFPTPAGAMAVACGTIELCVCNRCGFVFNRTFDPTLGRIGATYESSQAASAHFGAYAQSLAFDWVKRLGLAGKTVLEIGCGHGDFLVELLRAGVGKAIGLDPFIRCNRTVSEIRHAFGKNGGNMAEAGAVSWMFHKKGDIVVPKSAAKEDDLMAIVLEAGAEDLRDDGDNWEILSDTSAYEAVLEAVKKAGITPSSSSVTMIPQNYIKLEGSAAGTMIRLMEVLEDHDDVQNVHSNFDIDQKLLEEVAG